MNNVDYVIKLMYLQLLKYLFYPTVKIITYIRKKIKINDNVIDYIISILLVSFITLSIISFKAFIETKVLTNKISALDARINVVIQKFRLGQYITINQEKQISNSMIKYNEKCGRTSRISLMQCSINEQSKLCCGFWMAIRHNSKTNEYIDYIHKSVKEQRLSKDKCLDSLSDVIIQLSNEGKDTCISFDKSDILRFYPELISQDYINQIHTITNCIVTKDQESIPFLLLIRSEFDYKQVCSIENDESQIHRIKAILYEHNLDK